MSHYKLLTTRQVLKKLSIRSDDKVWTKGIRPILLEKYGMRKFPYGTRIPEYQLKKFMEDYFS